MDKFFVEDVYDEETGNFKHIIVTHNKSGETMYLSFEEANELCCQLAVIVS